MAVPMGSFAEVVLFGGFRRLVASFRVASVALRDIQTCFWNVSKVVLRGRRNTFVTFSEDVLQFSVAGAALWTCRVACFLQIALAVLRQVATRYKFRGRRGILCDVLKIDG